MNWPYMSQPNLILCRPALPLDTPGMLELTSQIWEGEDYVPDVWEDWMNDTEGLLAVAECGGKVVGLGKLTRLSVSDWWMEGLRVHPDFEGRGIASRLNEYLLDYWQRFGRGVVRLATSSSREPVKHLAIKNGFRIIAEYTTFIAPTINKSFNKSGKELFHPLDPNEVVAVIEWVTSPNKERLPFGMMDLGWQFAEPRNEYFSRYINNNQVWWWRNQQGILIMVEKIDGQETWARIRILACDFEDILEFLCDVRIFAGNNGYAGVTWMAPLIPKVVRKLSAAGFRRDWDASLLIFEKYHN